MQRIDTPTATAQRPPDAAGGTPGFFTSGNPTTGQPATTVSAEFLNGIQETICNVIEATGAVLNKEEDDQLTVAIKRLSQISVFDEDFAKRVAGYPRGALVVDKDSTALFMSLIDGNLSPPGNNEDWSQIPSTVWIDDLLNVLRAETEKQINEFEAKAEETYFKRSGGDVTGTVSIINHVEETPQTPIEAGKQYNGGILSSRGPYGQIGFNLCAIDVNNRYAAIHFALQKINGDWKVATFREDGHFYTDNGRILDEQDTAAFNAALNARVLTIDYETIVRSLQNQINQRTMDAVFQSGDDRVFTFPMGNTLQLFTYGSSQKGNRVNFPRAFARSVQSIVVSAISDGDDVPLGTANWDNWGFTITGKPNGASLSIFAAGH